MLQDHSSHLETFKLIALLRTRRTCVNCRLFHQVVGNEMRYTRRMLVACVLLYRWAADWSQSKHVVRLQLTRSVSHPCLVRRRPCCMLHTLRMLCIRCACTPVHMYVCMYTCVCTRIYKRGRLYVAGCAGTENKVTSADIIFWRRAKRLARGSSAANCHRDYHNMAASLRLNDIPSFLPTVAPPAIPWERWIQTFNAYVVASGGADMADVQKKNLLFYCMGIEGQRLFSAQHPKWDEDATSFTAMRDGAKAVFQRTRNATMERHKFYGRKQLPGETVQQFVNELRSLAVHCKFEGFHDTAIMDMLIFNTCHARVREVLLREDNLTLDRAMTIARGVEAGMCNASSILTAPASSESGFRCETGTHRCDRPGTAKWQQCESGHTASR